MSNFKTWSQSTLFLPLPMPSQQPKDTPDVRIHYTTLLQTEPVLQHLIKAVRNAAACCASGRVSQAIDRYHHSASIWHANLTPYSTLHVNLTPKILFTFIEPESSLPGWQMSTARQIMEHLNPDDTVAPHFFGVKLLTVFCHLRLGLLISLFPSKFPTKILFAFLVSSVHGVRWSRVVNEDMSVLFESSGSQFAWREM
jgi:hypothetical protein